jgi:DNA polymerase-3 subunit epsilon
MLDLSRPWTEHAIVVIDFETTGRDPQACEPVQVAAVRFAAGVEVARFASLIKPQGHIPPDSTDIHGITDQMVADAPTLGDVAVHIADIAKDAIPCAYNAPFDRTVLHRYLSGTGVPIFDTSMSWIDVFVIVASPRVDKYVGGTGRLKLGPTCERHGIALESAHSALADARATGQLLFKLHEKQLVKAVPAKRLLEYTDKMRAEQRRDYLEYRAHKCIDDMNDADLEAFVKIIDEAKAKAAARNNEAAE